MFFRRCVSPGSHDSIRPSPWPPVPEEHSPDLYRTATTPGFPHRFLASGPSWRSALSPRRGPPRGPSFPRAIRGRGKTSPPPPPPTPFSLPPRKPPPPGFWKDPRGGGGHFPGVHREPLASRLEDPLQLDGQEEGFRSPADADPFVFRFRNAQQVEGEIQGLETPLRKGLPGGLFRRLLCRVEPDEKPFVRGRIVRKRQHPYPDPFRVSKNRRELAVGLLRNLLDQDDFAAEQALARPEDHPPGR